MTTTPHAHCHFCGAPYEEAAGGWPRECRVCFGIAYRNPLPVAVCLVPIDGRRLLLVRRAIAPVGLVLPGGFVEYGEDWRTAAAREVAEETGVIINYESIRHEQALSTANGMLLLFGRCPSLSETELPAFVPNSEVSERVIVASLPPDIVFALHAQLIADFFAA